MVVRSLPSLRFFLLYLAKYFIEQKAKIYDLEKVLTISFYNISNPSRKVPVFNFPVTCVSCHGHDRQKFFILFMHYTCHIIPFTCS